MKAVTQPKQSTTVVPDQSSLPETDLEEAPLINNVPPPGKCQRLKRCVANPNVSFGCAQWLRKIIRLLFLAIVLGGLFGIIVLYYTIIYLDESHTLKGSNIELVVRDCTIYLRQDSSVSSSGVDVKVKAYNNDTTSTDNDNKLTVRNPWRDLKICEIVLSAKTSFPGIDIKCERQCLVEADEGNVVLTGKLKATTVEDEKLISQSRFKFKELTASEVEFNVMGTVSFDLLTTSNGGSFNMDHGDLYVNTEQNVKYNWETYNSGSHCFAAPTIDPVVKTNCQWSQLALTNSTSFIVEECQGIHSICQTASCSSPVTYNIRIQNGAIYHNTFTSGTLRDPYIVEKSTNAMNIDWLAYTQILNLRNATQMPDLNKDAWTFLNWPGINEDLGRWMYATNKAYAELKPWWIGLISLNLLVPRVDVYDFRVYPLACPLIEPLTSDEDLGLVWDILYESFGRRDQDKVVWMEKSKTKDDWYFFDLDSQGNFMSEAVDIEDNPFLISALAISMFLGLVIGIGGAVGIILTLKAYSVRFWEALEHKRRYGLVKKSIENRNQQEVREAQQAAEDEEDLMLGNPEDEEEEKQEYEVFEEEEQIKMAIGSNIIPGYGQLPPPYSVPDLMIVRMRQSSTNSLVEFLKVLMENKPDIEEVGTQQYHLIQIKQLYEEYCFCHEYVELNLKENKDAFAKYGVEFFTLNDATTEVFRKLRMKTKRELLDQGKKHQLPTEDSLSFFIRARCTITPFVGDVVPLKDLQSEYEKFARAERVTDPVPITKRAMESKGAAFERMQITAIKTTGTFKINIQKVQDLLASENRSPFPPGWLLYDFFSAILHSLFAIILVIPIILPLLLTEAKHAEWSARDTEDMVTSADLQWAWWNLADKLPITPLYVKVSLILGLVFLGFGVVELVTYYLSLTFPFNGVNLMASIKGFRRIFQYVYYSSLFLIFAWVCFLIMVGLCWYILGAVLNPDVFLPYATGAITLIGFVGDQLRKINFLRTEVLKRVKSAVWDKLRGMMLLTVGGLAAGAAVGAAGQGQNQNQENKTLELFAKTPLGGIAGSLGIDPKLATGLIQGDMSAIEGLGEKFGMNPLIVAAILAAIKKDMKKLMEVIGKLAQLPSILVDPEVCQMLVNLAWKHSDVNVRSAVKLATVLFGKIHKQYFGGQNIPGMQMALNAANNYANAPPKPPGQQVQPNQQGGPFDIDSRTVEALVAMARGSVDRLLLLAVDAAGFPDTIVAMLKLILALVKGQGNYMDAFVQLMQELLGIPENVCRGLGALCDETFASSASEADNSGFDNAIDALCQMLGIQESLPVQMIVHLARDAQGMLQRLLGHIVEYMNEKCGWNIDKNVLSALLAAVNGVDIKIERLSGKYALAIEMASCLSGIMSDKRFTDLRYKAQLGMIKADKYKGKGWGRMGMIATTEPDQQEQEQEQEEEKKGPSGWGVLRKARKTPGLDTSVLSAHQDLDPNIIPSPALLALAESHQPNVDSLEWMAKYFKLSAVQMLGLFGILRGARKRHNEALRELTQEVLRRMRLDEQYTDIITDITIWMTSMDTDSIRQAQANLNMQYRDLTFVAKRLLDPKELPDGYMIKHLKFRKDDPLVKRRKLLSWKVDPNMCKDWCRAVAIKVMESRKLTPQRKLMVRGQLIMAVQYPQLFVKSLMEKKCGADDEMHNKYKAIVRATFIWLQTPKVRRETTVNLARALDIDPDMLDPWLTMILDNDLNTKIEAMKRWLTIIGIQNETVEMTSRFLQDYANQEHMFYIAISSFQTLAKAVGVPEGLVNALSPNLFTNMKEYPEIFEEFLRMFCRELGMDNMSLQDAIIQFVKGKITALEPLSQALGLPSDGISKMLKLFGRQKSSFIIESVGELLKRIGASGTQTNAAKALTALVLNSNFRFTISKQGSLQNKANASEIIGEITGIPVPIIKGLILAKKHKFEEMKLTVIDLARNRLGGFQIDENVCRGFLSMVKGQVSNVEDISAAINFDADIAEILVQLSGNRHMTHTLLKTSSQFSKIAIKLGLDDVKMAAVIALVTGDVQHCQEIADDLDDSHGIPADFIRLVISLYTYCQSGEEWPRDYNPKTKWKLMTKAIPWICKLLNINSKLGATSILRLAQGDISVLGHIYEKLGWSGIQRSYYASIAALVHPLSFHEHLRSDIPFAWMVYKHLPSICTNLGNLFQLSPSKIELIIKFARRYSVGIMWAKNVLQLTSIKDVHTFLDEVLADGEANKEEENEDIDFQLDEVEFDAASLTGSSLSGSESMEEWVEGQELENLVTDQDFAEIMKMLGTLVEDLNKDIPADSRQFDQDIVRLLILLSNGHLKHMELIKDVLAQIYGDNAPVKYITIKELLAICSGDISAIKELGNTGEQFYSVGDMVKDDEELADSLLNFFHLDPNCPELQFLVQLAKGDHKCWEIASDSGQLFGARVHHNIKLIQAISSLCSHNYDGVMETLPALTTFCEMDNDMAQAIIMIAMRNVDRLPSGIVPLCSRLEVDPAIAAAFIPMCYKNKEQLESALMSVCERISVPATNPQLVASIIHAANGDLSAWIQIAIFVLGIHKYSERENTIQVRILRELEKILKDEWKSELKEKMFNIEEQIQGIVGGENQQDDFDYVSSAEKGIELVQMGMAGSDVLLNALGFGRLSRNSVFRRLVRADDHANIPRIIMDLVIGIANKDPKAIIPVLQLFGLPRNVHQLLVAIFHIFNKNNAMLAQSTEVIENHIQDAGIPIPPGALQAIIAAEREYPSLMTKGVSRCVAYLAEKGVGWVSKFTPMGPEIIMALVQRRLDDNYDLLYEHLPPFLINITNVDVSPDDPRIKMILMFLMGETAEFIKIAASQFGLPVEALEDIYSLAVTGNPLGVKTMKWMTSQLHRLFPQIPMEALDALMMIISQNEEELDAGREGMGKTLYTIMKYFVTKLPAQYRLKALTGSDKIDELADNGEPAEIKILDAFFLACTDPQKYKNAVIRAMPDLGRALMPGVASEALVLLYGLVALFQSDGDAESKEQAILKLAAAFGIDPVIVKGLIALSKGDWEGMADMASRICEFDVSKVTQMIQLLKRLKIINESEAEMGLGEKTELERLKDKIDQGADAEQIFHMLDVDGSGSLDFEEFAEVMKFFDLKFSNERLLQIFAKFDIDGSASMNLQEFEAAMDYIKSQISDGAMMQLGLTKNQLLTIFFISLAFLLFLFAFIFLGIIAFIGVSRFGTGVNSLMPISAGGILGKLRGTGSNLESKINEIGGKISNVLTVMTVNDL